jgi:peptidoglycan/LPS O-acetylase OafA/YrhL
MPIHPSDPSSTASSASRADLNPLVESPVNRTRIAELESVRGIAALLIVMFHAPGWNTGKEHIGIFQNAYLMVDLFFVISGFVIYKAYANHLHSWSAVWRFQFLRLGRLYPVHLFFLIFFLVTLAIPWPEMKVAFIEQLFLVQALGPTGNSASFNYPAWSISVEFYTYFLFALIAWLAGRGSKSEGTVSQGSLPKRGHLQLIIYSVIAFGAWYSLFENELYGFRDLLRCLAGFFIGCLCAALAATVRWRWPNYLAPLCFIAIGLFLEFKHNKNLSYDPAIFILTALLILSLVFSTGGWFKKLLHTRPLLWLGEISYSLYMAQLACIFICEGVLRGLYKRFALFGQIEDLLGIHLAYPVTMADGLIKYGFFFVVLLTVSSLSYYLIERQCREASRRQIHRPKLIAP